MQTHKMIGSNRILCGSVQALESNLRGATAVLTRFGIRLAWGESQSAGGCPN